MLATKIDAGLVLGGQSDDSAELRAVRLAPSRFGSVATDIDRNCVSVRPAIAFQV
jgi:hypothetical protein